MFRLMLISKLSFFLKSFQVSKYLEIEEKISNKKLLIY